MNLYLALTVVFFPDQPYHSQ